MPGCGKEELIRVAQELGFSVVRMGDTVREEAARRKLGTSDEAIGGFAHREREAHGYGVWAERTLPRVVGAHLLIARLRARNRSDAPASWEEFLGRDRRELAWGLGDVIATADFLIVNEGDLGSFRARAREGLESVLGGSSHV